MAAIRACSQILSLSACNLKADLETHCALQEGARPPPILEEGEFQLERKRRLWPFGGVGKGSGGEFKRGVEWPFQ